MLPKATRMRRRAEFVQATRMGKRIVTPNFVLQLLPQNAKNISKNASNYTLGITASRKVGGAVQRNRAKRRLRALLKNVLLSGQNHAEGNHSEQDKPYRLVMVARYKCINAKFASMQDNLTNALATNLPQNTLVQNVRSIKT